MGSMRNLVLALLCTLLALVQGVARAGAYVDVLDLPA